MCVVNDGYIIGAISPHQKNCPRCGTKTRCIDIAELRLPEGVTAKATILFDRSQEDPRMHVAWIGLGCGDYAKFHRQMAHIQGSRMGSGQAT